MAVWVLVLFLLGLVALVCSLFNVFSWFVQWWGALLMIVAFGMLVRIWRKEKEGEREQLIKKIQELETLAAKEKLEVKL